MIWYTEFRRHVSNETTNININRWQNVVSLNNVSLDDLSGILYPLDFVSLGRWVPWMICLIDNASVTDGSCYIVTDWPFACRGAARHWTDIFRWVITQNYLPWQVPPQCSPGSGHIGHGRHVEGTQCRRATSSKGNIVQGTERPGLFVGDTLFEDTSSLIHQSSTMLIYMYRTMNVKKDGLVFLKCWVTDSLPAADETSSSRP